MEPGLSAHVAGPETDLVRLTRLNVSREPRPLPGEPLGRLDLAAVALGPSGEHRQELRLPLQRRDVLRLVEQLMGLLSPDELRALREAETRRGR